MIRERQQCGIAGTCRYYGVPMTRLTHDRYCDEVVVQTGMLTDVLRGADLSVTVPTCPDWTLAGLVRHIGGNLRSVETAVRTGIPVEDPGGQVPDVAGPDGDDPATLEAWLAGAAVRCAGTLRDAGPSGTARIWAYERSTASWARRAVNDLVVHRADAAGTVHADYTVAPELAADAIDELLGMAGDPQIMGSSPGVAQLRGPPRSIHLHATDTEPELAAEWLIELGPDGFTDRSPTLCGCSTVGCPPTVSASRCSARPLCWTSGWSASPSVERTSRPVLIPIRLGRCLVLRDGLQRRLPDPPRVVMPHAPLFGRAVHWSCPLTVKVRIGTAEPAAERSGWRCRRPPAIGGRRRSSRP
jgi:uncharacterized protein (TIGR03083 family)